jgi:hypothetical protein
MESTDERNKKESIMQFVEEIPDYPYYVSINFEKISNQSISKKGLLNFLNQFRPPYIFHGPMANFYYSAQDWELVISLIKKENAEQKRTRGFTQQRVKLIDNFKPLYTALNDKKPSKYSIGDAPYFICIGVDDLTANEYEFFNVLFGAQDMNTIYLNWKGTGFFLKDGIPINTSVSAVLFCKSLKEYGLTATDLSLWHNPFASNPINVLDFPIKEIRYIQNQNSLVRETSEAKVTIFDLLEKEKCLYLEYLDMKYRVAPGE